MIPTEMDESKDHDLFHEQVGVFSKTPEPMLHFAPFAGQKRSRRPATPSQEHGLCPPLGFQPALVFRAYGACRPPGTFKRQPKSPNVHIWWSRRFKHHQNSTRRPPREGRKNQNCGGRVEKKREMLGGPAEGGSGSWTVQQLFAVLTCQSRINDSLLREGKRNVWSRPPK